MKTRTVQNLKSAMQSEAVAYANFSIFAAAARLHHDQTSAALFEEAADVDRRRHFACEAELAHLTGSAQENLQSALQTVIRQMAMYDTFIRQATSDGDLAVVRVLESVRHDKLTQLLAFCAALQENQQSEETPFAPLFPCQLADQRNSQPPS
jgi:rubrerythrin